MPVLDRSELEASPLADLHAIANELGVDGFRLLPREELIDAILGEESEVSARDLRPVAEPTRRSARDRDTGSRRRRATERSDRGDRGERRPSERTRTRSSASERGTERRSAREQVEGVVELRDNGAAFLRVDPPGPSDDDVYISPAQVKRCELSSGDTVSGPVRRPRRSERHPSLARIETINGEPAETGARASGSGARAEARGERERTARPRAGREREDREQTAESAFPTEPLRFGSKDATVQAVESLAPIGQGSRAVIVGGSRAGKTELLRRMLEALAAQGALDLSLVLVGVRPEEIAEWEVGPVKPAAALSFAASPDEQDRAVEQALQKATRAASGGKNAVVLVDTLDGLHPNSARKALASAQKNAGPGRSRSRRGKPGSLTVVGTATRPYGGETTVIALDVALASSGRFPAIDVMASGTLRPELLVGEEGAREIMRAHASHAPAAKGWRRLFRR
jgi:transcription termination factor Rho